MTQKQTSARVRTSARSGDLAGKRVSRCAAATPEVWRKTAHFSERQGQRRISDIEVGLALRFGARFHEGGDCVHFLGRKNLPLDLEGQAAARIRERANGVVVVRRRDGSLTTTYRNPRYIAKLKRRQRRHRRQRRRGGCRGRDET